jgi:hypothetical protein
MPPSKNIKTDKSKVVASKKTPESKPVEASKKSSHKEERKSSHKEERKSSHKDKHKSSRKEESDKEESDNDEVEVVKKEKQKPVEKKGSDKGLNKETISVGLMFNVKPYKNWLKTYYNNTGKNNVKIMNAHYMMASMNEVLVFNLLCGASEMIQKQKTGLLDLTLERFLMYIQRTDNLLSSFSRFHSRYEPGFDYSKLIPLDKNIVARFIEKKCFHKNDALNINKDTLNYLSYLIAQTNTHCAEIAYVFSQYARKTTVTADGIKAAIQVFFNGKVLIDIMTKLEQITRILKNKSKKDSDKDNEDGKGGDEDDDDNDEEEEDNNDDDDDDEEESDESDEE